MLFSDPVSPLDVLALAPDGLTIPVNQKQYISTLILNMCTYDVTYVFVFFIVSFFLLIHSILSNVEQLHCCLHFIILSPHFSVSYFVTVVRNNVLL